MSAIEEVKEYMNKLIKKHSYAFFPNGFPYTNLSEEELEELFLFLSEIKIDKLTIARKIKWKKLPKNITKITTLKSLIINTNNIQSLPSNLSDLVNLENITISRCSFEKFNFSFKTFKNLKILKLTNLRIDNLPNLSSLDKLESLIINDNKYLKEIPSYLCSLKLLKLIDVRNLNIDSFPSCLIDRGVKIKTNDVVNLGVSHVSMENYKIHIQIRDELKIVLKQYLSYFSQYVKRTKQENIDFSISDSNNGLFLNFKVKNDDELVNLKEDLSNYMSFIEKPDNQIIPHINKDTSEYDKMMIMLELKQQVRQYQLMMENAQDNLKVVSSLCNIPYTKLEHVSASTMIEGLNKLSSCTPISNIYLEQNNSQTQQQNQEQQQQQELKNNLEPLSEEFYNILNLIKDTNMKKEGENIINELYPIIAQPSEEKISDSGIMSKMKNFIKKVNDSIEFVDDTKETYNKFANSYNGIANILKLSTLALLN